MSFVITAILSNHVTETEHHKHACEAIGKFVLAHNILDMDRSTASVKGSVV